MRSRLSVHPIVAAVLTALCMSLAACGEQTRIATLNATNRISGTRVAMTVQRQLATQGYPNATVSCARSMIVNVGPLVSCELTGAGAKGTVKFTFRTLGGEIDLASVRAS